MEMDRRDPLAIIAGGGALPATIAAAVRNQGRDVFIIALEGFATPEVEAFPHRWLRIGQFSKGLTAMRSAGCREVVLIGSVRRPMRWRADAGLSLAWTVIRYPDLLWSGDATLLARIIHLLEREGLTVRGAQELVPELLLPVGQAGQNGPSDRDQRDIAIGIKAARRLGTLDIGQSVVVSRGRVVAIEAAEGTDAMIARAGELNRNRRDERAGVLVKWPQPIQDLRIDMPTIGSQTVRLAADAGLSGIAVAGNMVLAVDIGAIIEAADRSGLFLLGCPAGGETAT